MKHPFAVGAAVGITGLLLWWKRRPIAAFVHRHIAMHGAGGLPGEGAVARLSQTADPNICVRQIKRYTFAAMQNQSPIVGLTHASYALILMDTLEEMVGREAIRTAGYDASAVRELITKLQDQHAERLRACDPYITKVLDLEKGGGAALPGFVLNGGFGLGAPTGG